MPNWAQNGPKWSKTCYIDHLGSFWALLDRFGTSASLPCSAIFGPKRAIMIRGSQKGGVGGGSDVWEKFPNNIVFFVWQRTLVSLGSTRRRHYWEILCGCGPSYCESFDGANSRACMPGLASACTVHINKSVFQYLPLRSVVNGHVYHCAVKSVTLKYLIRVW